MDKQLAKMINKMKTPLRDLSEPPYAGIRTFFHAPFKEDLENLDIALIGVPFDGGVCNRTGARFGPLEMRNQSNTAGNYNHQLKMSPFSIARIADIGDIPLKDRYTLDESIKGIESFYKKIVKAKVAPVTAGGDHSITYPILKALGAKYPLGLVHFDSHCDTAGAYCGSKFYHGAPFRQAVEARAIDPKRTIQIGIRGHTEPLWRFSYDKGMRVMHVEEFYELGWKKVVEEIKRVIGSGPAYITFDVDFLDPAYAPGTGTPVAGGVSTFEAQQVLRGLRGLNIVGGDVVEVSPPYDVAGNTALVGAAMMFEILCLVSETVVR